MGQHQAAVAHESQIRTFVILDDEEMLKVDRCCEYCSRRCVQMHDVSKLEAVVRLARRGRLKVDDEVY